MPTNPTDLRSIWQSHWQSALRCWSPYTQLSEPAWCLDAADEKREGLTSSFAMIRLLDHRVVISLPQVAAKKLDDFAVEILAHEIGHHVYCPADLTDNARMLARLRHGLPSREHLAPFIGNLYTDHLINDRLQRSNQLRIADVYRRLAEPSTDRLWLLYMRTYEMLWQLDRLTLAKGDVDARINNDARLAMRLVRSYAKDWLRGAGRFAALCLPYLLDEKYAPPKQFHVWNDTQSAGEGGIPDGLVEIDPDELDAIHPSEDPELSGVEASQNSDAPAAATKQPTPTITGLKTLKTYRTPVDYADVLKAAGCTLPQDQIVARYYRERATPHLIPFPSRDMPQATDPLPEGLDPWDIGSPLENVDWMGTVLASPVVIPGVTTRERLYGHSPGNTPEKLTLDLYLGVDCSGSMGNPAVQMSYPILAGAIIALSALRAGAKVMVALSGEPGRTITTTGFIRDELAVLKTLTDYLGTGYTFGIHRLADTFPTLDPRRRPAHILIVTDNDIFMMLKETVKGKIGWDVARQSAKNAKGGATYVLQLPKYLMAKPGAKETILPGEDQMQSDGWTVAHVDSEDDLVSFARQFSRARYGQ